MSELDELFRRDPLKLTKSREQTVEMVADLRKKRQQLLLPKKKISDTELSNLLSDLFAS